MKNNKNIIDVIGISSVDILSKYKKGKFRHIVKVKAGWTTCSDARGFDNTRMLDYPESIISGYKKGSLQTVEFCPDGSDYYLTVFARVGKSIKIMDESIMANLTVGTVNSIYDNTILRNPLQMESVKASTWASNAFVMNE